MQDQPNQVLGESDPRVERAIVLQLLSDDHEHRWSRAELQLEISKSEVLDLSDALARLDQDGIVRICGESAWASRAVRRLDELELIAI
jgi:hypothetical protein